MNNKIEMKMKKNQLTMLVLFVTMLGFTACSDDDKVSISTVGITTTVDTTIEGLQLTGGTYTFENVNTSVKTDITYPAQSIELADGLYNVTFIGKGTYSQNGTPVEVDVQGVQQNVAVSGGSYKLELKVHVLNTGDPDFVIAEIFIPGQQPGIVGRRRPLRRRQGDGIHPPPTVGGRRQLGVTPRHERGGRILHGP